MEKNQTKTNNPEPKGFQILQTNEVKEGIIIVDQKSGIQVELISSLFSVQDLANFSISIINELKGEKDKPNPRYTE